MEYMDWLVAAGDATDALLARADAISAACPHCGSRSLDLQYIADPESRTGWGLIWCKSCLHGLRLYRLSVRPGVPFLPLEAADQIAVRLPARITEVVPKDREPRPRKKAR